MRNNNGPKIDPCGTPLITYKLNQDDVSCAKRLVAVK